MCLDAIVQQILVCVLNSVRIAVLSGSVVDPVGNAHVHGEHQDKSTQHDFTIPAQSSHESNAQSDHRFSVSE